MPVVLVLCIMLLSHAGEEEKDERSKPCHTQQILDDAQLCLFYWGAQIMTLSHVCKESMNEAMADNVHP